MRKIVILAMGLVASATALAQDKIEATIGADFVSQYIWRGLDCGNVSLQPTLGIAYKGFSLSAWGSVGFKSEDTKEFDLTASYTVGGLTVEVTDYWFDSPEKRYFYYNAHSTSHVFEASVAYDFGLLSAAWYTNFAGNDGLNKSGKRAYSSYFEVNAPFKLATCDWTGTLGVVPYATDFYDTTGFAVTNVALKASKDIKITDSFSVPIFGQVIANPCSQKAYFVFGFTLKAL
ncbi:MAG: hypothetical protein IJ552_00240 [Prevotella sp.]|nr:hypothetical protein [Prevotella sp.]MBQ8713615.1 hypothetical protein [Prevotella sp.]